MKRVMVWMFFLSLLLVVLTGCDSRTDASIVVSKEDVITNQKTIHRVVVEAHGRRFVLSADDETNAKIIVGETAYFDYDKKNNITTIQAG
jgi:uncharacterized protein YcfL